MTCSYSILGVKVRVDEGYRGLATAFPEQVTAPPRKPPKDAAAELVDAYRQAAPTSPPGGSAWSMRSPSTSNGARCSAGSAAGSTSARPTWRSRAWSRAGPLDANRAAAGPVSPTPSSLSRTKS